MPTIIEKDPMVQLLREEFDAVADLCGGLDAADWDRPTCLPGWTVRDNLSHMVGTESMLAGDEQPTVDLSHLHHMKNPIAEANESWVESMRDRPGAEVLTRFREVTARRLASLEAMTQEDFDAPSWTPAGPDETYGRFMRIRHYDCFMHEHDIREALGAGERAEAHHLASALDEVRTGLGYIVGRKARMPSGSRVRIRLTGPVEVTFLVAVAERAAVVEELDGEPTTGLTMPAMLFLRLTGGRREPGDDLGTTIATEGDPELARQLASHLAFTI